MGDLIIDAQIQQAIKQEVDKKTKKLQKDIINLQKIIIKCVCKDCPEILTCEEKPP